MSVRPRLPASLIARAWLVLVYISFLYGVVIVVAGFFFWLAFIDYGPELNRYVFLRLYSLLIAVPLLWAIRPKRDVFEPTGLELKESDQPEFFAIVRAVAAACAQRMPDVTYLEPEAQAWAAYRGGIGGVGRRPMIGIGLPLMATLTVHQVKAVLAHEFSHLAIDASFVLRTASVWHRGAANDALAKHPGIAPLIRRWVLRPLVALGGDLSHQIEHISDEVSAQVVSATGVSVALTRIREVSALEFEYMTLSVEPALDAGVHPPISEGLARFIRRPFAETIGQFWTSLADDIEATGEGSHPPTALRVAMMNARKAFVEDSHDQEAALGVLRNVRDLEAGTFKWQGESLHQMRRVSWAEAAVTVGVRNWQKAIDRYRAALQTCRIDRLPDGEGMVQLGRLVREPLINLADDDELRRKVQHAIGCAICLKLHAQGWQMPDEALESPEFFREEHQVQPFHLLGEHEDANRERWADFCRRTGLTGPLL